MLIQVEIYEQQGLLSFRVAEHEPEPDEGSLIAILSFRTDALGMEIMYRDGLCPRQLSATVKFEAHRYGTNWYQQWSQNNE